MHRKQQCAYPADDPTDFTGTAHTGWSPLPRLEQIWREPNERGDTRRLSPVLPRAQQLLPTAMLGNGASLPRGLTSPSAGWTVQHRGADCIIAERTGAKQLFLVFCTLRDEGWGFKTQGQGEEDGRGRWNAMSKHALIPSIHRKPDALCRNCNSQLSRP